MPASTSIKLQTSAALFVLVVGIVLMGIKIYADSEPGLIPIVLVLLGGGWLLTARIKGRARVPHP